MPEENKVAIVIDIQNAEKVKQVLSDLGVQFKQIGSNIGQAAKPVSLFSGTIGHLVKQLLSLYTAMKVFQFLKSTIKEAAEAELTIKKLSIAVENAGISWQVAGKRIQSFLKELQKTTIYSDEEAAEALKKLLFYTSDLNQAMEGVKIAMGLASSGLFDLDTAARYVGMALSGNVEVLGRYIPKLKTTTNEQLKGMNATEKTAYALELLKGKIAGMTEKELETFLGKTKQMANSFSELKERIGEVLIEKLKLKDVLEFWTNVLDETTPKTKEMSLALTAMTEQLKKATEESNRLYGILAREGDMYVYVDGILMKVSEGLKRQEQLRLRLIQVIKGQIEEEKKAAERQEQLAQENKAEQERIAIQEEFNAEYKKILERRKDYQLKILDELYEKYKEHVIDKAELDDWYQTRKKELEEQEQKASVKTFDAMEEMAVGAYKNITSSFETFFVDVFHGQLKKAGDYFVAFGEMMIQTIAQVIAKVIVMRTVMAFFPGWGALLGLHSGGEVRKHYGGAIYAHSGLAPDEVPIIAQTGEGIISRRGMAAIGSEGLREINRGETTERKKVIFNIFIQAIDTKDFRERLMENPDIFESAIMSAVDRSKTIRHLLRQRV